MITLSTFDTHSELLLKRHKHGVFLTKPSSLINFSNLSIASLYTLPINAYFMDRDSKIIHSNEASVQILGADSLKDIVGETVEKFVKNKSCREVLNNDKGIIRTELMKVTEESVIRNDDYPIQSLSFKFPWYSENDVVGIFGFSITTSFISVSELAKIIFQLMMTGLLNTSHISPNTVSLKTQHSETYLTQREREVLSYVVRGKTAKEIANRLSISRRTVEHHINALKFKTNCHYKSELIDKFT